jgi:DNA-binding NtrC family response regulator
MAASILLITAEDSLRQSVDRAIGGVSGCRLIVLDELGEGGHLPGLDELALVFFHLREPHHEADFIRLLHEVASSGKPIAVVAIGDAHRPEQAANLLRRGAADYLTRPLNIARLAFMADVLTIRSRNVHAWRNVTPDSDTIQRVGKDNSFLYRSKRMTDIVEQARTIANLDTTILLTGETGTGKNHFARLIHELSHRSSQPFKEVSCGALATTLVESEMFGHVKGAFTSADNDRLGKFTAAGKVTLMLDEIDSLPLSTQAKLLSVVDQRVFEPVGSDRSLPLRARIIVATNRCLEDEVASGRFRSDLYYRVNVVPIELPPLRKRREVITPLVESCLAEFAASHGTAKARISAKALAVLEAYAWPGNIRELRNVIERLSIIRAAQEIQRKHLPDLIRIPALADSATVGQGVPTTKWLQTRVLSEVNAIVESLARNRNNRASTARELGISRVTLYKKLHKYNLQ